MSVHTDGLFGLKLVGSNRHRLTEDFIVGDKDTLNWCSCIEDDVHSVWTPTHDSSSVGFDLPRWNAETLRRVCFTPSLWKYL